MLNRRSNQHPWQCRCISDAGVYRKKEIPHHGRAADFFGGVATFTTTELSSCDDCNFFLCSVHLREGRSDGRSPVPKLQLQFLYLPCLQETDFCGMCFLAPPLRANFLAKGAYVLTPTRFITPINNWGASENFPARKQDNKKATTFALYLCAGSGPMREN
ncbi:hypothetical protein TNCV_2461821 [Trichonephila clavipes]|nr:hypothetical protein TNCV_2461821 [Trichonephila clavipes]